MKKKMLKGALYAIQGLVYEVLQHDSEQVVSGPAEPEAPADAKEYSPPMVTIPQSVFNDLVDLLTVTAQDVLYLNELRYPPDMCERWESALREHADATATANTAQMLLKHCKEQGWLYAPILF